METDRGAVLTIRAAVGGVIDFTKADLRDVGWWRRSNVLIKAMHLERELEITKAAYGFQCSLVANGSLTEDSFKKTQARAKETFNDIVNRHQPWAAKSTEEIRDEELNSLVELYRETVGDPRDPEFMARIEANIEELRRAEAAAPVEDEMARVARLSLEYAAERQRRLDELKKG